MATWCRLAVDGKLVFGLVEGDCVTLVTGSPFDTWTPPRIHCGPHDFRLLVPVVPGNFYAAGLNYRAHIEWAAGRHGIPAKVPAHADVGYRSVNALVAGGEPIVIPKDSPGPVEYEGELVAVIGRRARNVSEGEALGCVLGSTLGNDVTQRAGQRGDRALLRAQDTDAVQPMGPAIVAD